MLSPEAQVRLRWGLVLAVVVVFIIGRANGQTLPAWWEQPNPVLEACDDLAASGQLAEATYCVARYQAAAAAVWTDSADPQFAAALPVLGLLLAAGLGFSIGSAVYPR